ncbi:MAG: helix-turn-helix domain-containing protein [Bacteroidales bacterium]|jgi:AraC-like DNA-binding protein|nr:helix-turn-helix domain-containing protein [Bacteroidales bacterium]
MAVHFANPSPLLLPFIKRYWAIENTLECGQTCVQRILPTGFCELMLYFSPRPQTVGCNRTLTDNVALYGHLGEYYDIEYQGDLEVFSIVFQPQGLMQFFRFPLNEIFNINVPLQHLIGQVGRELEEQMGSVTNFEARVGIAENYFIASLQRQYEEYEFRRLHHVIETLVQRRGEVSVDEMASAACLSRRQFERVFAERIGASPKQYLKTVRFQRTLYEKQRNNSLSMTELAIDCGYYDQAHFIADFKSICGQTPLKFFQENEACSDFF